MTHNPVNTNAADDGSQVHEKYSALWPQKAIGVYNPTSTVNGPWTDAEAESRRGRVAIIDTSIAVYHPNLKAGIKEEWAIDLVSSKLGTFPYIYPIAPNATGHEAQKKPTNSADSIDTSNLKAQAVLPENFGLDYESDLFSNSRNSIIKQLWGRFSNRCKSGELAHGKNGAKGKPSLIAPATDWRNSSHGTAIAGLIGGRPTRAHLVDYGIVGSGAGKVPEREALFPFAGIDPFCEMVPISTGFDPDPEQLILALMYTELIQADIVVIPRDFPDPWRTKPNLENLKPTSSVVKSSPELLDDLDVRKMKEKWDALKEVIDIVSKRRVLICAAGNTGDDMAIYPAYLSQSNDNIISVGAVNFNQDIAGYSVRGKEVTVMAPSGDGERYDREEIRLNHQRTGFNSQDVKADYPQDPPAHQEYGFHDVISTDLPGNFGYNRGSFDKPFLESKKGRKQRLKKPDADRRLFDRPIMDRGSLYCAFGGTSAACAITAGFISLGISSGKIKVTLGDTTSTEIKKWFKKNTVKLSAGGFTVLKWNR